MAKFGKKKDDKINYTVVEQYGFLNDRHNKIVAKVSWYENQPTIDIRKCMEQDTGEVTIFSGISLNENELKKALKLLQKASGEDVEELEEEEDPDVPPWEEEDKPEVNFDEVFRSSEGILEKRKNGITTVDGFMTIKSLQPTPRYYEDVNKILQTKKK